MPRVFAEVAGNHLSFTLTAGLTFGSRTTRSTFHPAARRYVNRWLIALKPIEFTFLCVGVDRRVRPHGKALLLAMNTCAADVKLSV